LKTKELIAVDCSSVGRCPHCTDGHLAKAKEVGASEEEIAEALAVAWSQGGGTQAFWMYEDFDELLGEGWRQEFIPEADRAFWAFQREIYETGALNRKVKELIAVAVSSMLRCRHCTRGHIQGAFKAERPRRRLPRHCRYSGSSAPACRSSGTRRASRSISGCIRTPESPPRGAPGGPRGRSAAS
jgi:AhpD family alkylhydroperoxidase